MAIIKIDYDFMPEKEWMEKWIETRKIILQHLGYTVKDMRIAKTSRGFHAYIEIQEDVKPKTLNMLQFICGDDAARVRINSWRIEQGVKHWNKLFAAVIYRKGRKYIQCAYCGNKIVVDLSLIHI